MGEPGTISPLAINKVRNEGTAQSVYAFTGEMFDPQTGLVFLRARYLDVSDGRLLSRDTWTGEANTPTMEDGLKGHHQERIKLVHIHMNKSGQLLKQVISMQQDRRFSPS